MDVTLNFEVECNFQGQTRAKQVLRHVLIASANHMTVCSAAIDRDSDLSKRRSLMY